VAEYAYNELVLSNGSNLIAYLPILSNQVRPRIMFNFELSRNQSPKSLAT